MEKIKKFFNFKEMSKQKKVLTIAGLSSIVGLAIYLIIGGSSSSNNGIKVIPKNTAGVVIIDLGALYDKADVDELLKLDIVKEGLKLGEQMLDDMPFNDIIKDPNESGIDLYSEIFIFSSLSIKKQYVCVSIGISDEDKFNKLIKDLDFIFEDGIEDNDDEDYKYIVNGGRDNFGLAWDNEVLLFISSPESTIDDDIENELERLMTLESEDRITSNDNFNDFYSRRTDICAWVSTDFIEDISFVEIMAKGFIKDMNNKIEEEYDIDLDLSFDDLLGNSAVFFFNFGEGNISIKSGIYLNDKIQKVVEKVSSIDPEELSIELIVTFDASGRNSLNAIIMTAYNIAEKFGEEVIKEAIDEGIGFGGNEAVPLKLEREEPYKYNHEEDHKHDNDHSHSH